MIRSKIIRLCDSWIRENRKFLFEPVIFSKRRGIVAIRFYKLSNSITWILSWKRICKNIYFDSSLAVVEDGKFMDLLLSEELLVGVNRYKKFYCYICKDEEQAYESSDQLITFHCLDPVKHFINNMVNSYKYICLISNGESTWCELMNSKLNCYKYEEKFKVVSFKKILK